MTRVLVTGGTGVLGHAVVRELASRGATVRVFSRRASPQRSTVQDRSADVEWAQGDLASGAGLDAAFEGVDALVHSASSQKQGEETLIARWALDASRRAGVQHALYISIVGIDDLDFFGYYAQKLKSEQLFAESGLPYSVQRATQFHDFVAYLLTRLGRGPLLVLPRGVTLQPVAPTAVAARIAEAALSPASGRLPDLAGPEVRALEDLARAWLNAQNQRKRIVSLPLPLPIFQAMSSGQLTSERAQRIGPTWEAWLKQHASLRNAYQQVRARSIS